MKHPLPLPPSPLGAAEAVAVELLPGVPEAGGVAPASQGATTAPTSAHTDAEKALSLPAVSYAVIAKWYVVFGCNPLTVNSGESASVWG